jgi:hypothetical protein
MIMNSADALISATEMSPTEVAFVHQRLMVTEMQVPRESTIGDFAQDFQVMPMLVARTLLDARPEDQSLRSIVATNEFLIKTFGKSRVGREVVEGGYVKMDKFWRNNDPLGVYRPGDMFYVDDNHPWMPYFPLLILAPSAFLTFLLFVAWVAHVVAK